MSFGKLMEDVGKKIIVIGIPLIIIIVILIVINPFVKVGPGERGILIDFGKPQDTVLSEGLHFIIPIKQEVEIMDVKVQKIETDADAASIHQQKVITTIALNYHIQPDKVNKLYQEIGKNYRVKVIDPAIKDVVKNVTAKYSAEELITKRNEVRGQISTTLSERLKSSYIIIDEFSIVNFSFSKRYQESIEQKLVAEQQEKRAKLELKRIQIEKDQKITQAQAEAEALRIQREIVTPNLIKLRQIEATLAAIKKWDGRLPNVTSGAVPFVDVKDYETTGK